MAIAGVVMVVEEGCLARLQAALTERKEISLVQRPALDEAKLCFVFEKNSKEIMQELEKLKELEGVLSLGLAYLNYEDES